MSDPRVSADGLYWWDGARWVPRQQPGTPAPYRPEPRVPTSWTQPLQYAVAGAFALWGVYSISVPFWMKGAMDSYMRQLALRQAQQAPELYPNPNQYADMMSTMATASLVVGVVIAAAIAIVVVVGVLRRWTWLYYAVLVLLALQVAGLPFQAATALGGFGAVAPGFALPSFLTWFSVASGIIALALGGWMVVALVQRGPWAMRRLSAGQ